MSLPTTNSPEKEALNSSPERLLLIITMSSHSACLRNLNADPGADLEYLQVLQNPVVTSGTIPCGWRRKLSKIVSFPQISLDNKIHPLFQMSRWSDINPEDYTLLLPALRIASKFMTEPLILKWWKHTLFGRVEFDRTCRRYLASAPYETSNYADSELHVLLTKKIAICTRTQIRKP